VDDVAIMSAAISRNPSLVCSSSSRLARFARSPAQLALVGEQAARAAERPGGVRGEVPEALRVGGSLGEGLAEQRSGHCGAFGFEGQVGGGAVLHRMKRAKRIEWKL